MIDDPGTGFGNIQRLCQKVMQLQHLDSARAFVIKRFAIEPLASAKSARGATTIGHWSAT